MHVARIEFHLEKTTPLEPLTHNDADRYANVKPAAVVVIDLNPNDSIDKAFTLAREICFTQLVSFHEDLTKALKA